MARQTSILPLNYSLNIMYKFIKSMGVGIEPTYPDYEPDELPNYSTPSFYYILTRIRT